MAKAIRMHQHGGPEVLRWEEVDPAPPAPVKPSCATRPSA